VKRSRLQSQEAPILRIWAVIWPPEVSFQRHTRSTKASRPISWRSRPSLASSRSTTFWVAIPAWSVPGSHRAAQPRIRLRRMVASMSECSKAWPMWSEPVMLGGGMTMQNGSPSGLTSGRKAPDSSHVAYQRASAGAGS
jgi:hypothetical protein